MKRIVLLVAASAMVLAGVSWAEEAKPLSGKEIFEAKCSICHSTDRPLGKTKSQSGWDKTVTRMRGKKADWISGDEAKAIADYLTEIRGK